MKPSLRDLHALTRSEGHGSVAERIGITGRSLIDKRSGRCALNVDDLHALVEEFPDFDLLGTVQKIGALRASKR